MDKEKIKFSYYLQYIFVRIMVVSLRIFPLCIVQYLGYFLGYLWLIIGKRHRNIAINQVKTILKLDDKEAKKFVRKNYAHYGLNLVEFARLNTMDKEKLALCCENLDLVLDKFKELEKLQRGAILITAHAGNWEYAAAICGAYKLSEGSIARPLKNLLVDNYIRKIRESSGNTIWDKKGAIRKAMSAIKNKKSFGILIDQDAGLTGEKIPFLGKDASTLSIPAQISVKMNVPIIIGILNRKDNKIMNFTFQISDIIFPDTNNKESEEVKNLLTKINSCLDKFILNYPEQWLWIHRRWKTQL